MSKIHKSTSFAGIPAYDKEYWWGHRPRWRHRPRWWSLVFLLILNFWGADTYGQTTSPLIRIGVIADIQYGDVDPAGTRYYRNSLQKLEECVADLNTEKVDFSINLGDLVDRNPADMEAVLTRLKALDQTVYNTPGNHDYVGITDNKALYRQLGMPGEYYSVRRGKWLFIMLNTNEIASYANVAGTEKEKELAAALERIQKSGRINGKPWNGGISLKQTKWLTKLLKKAEKKGRNVMVLSHHPLFPEEGYTALNGKEILETLSSFSCVKGVISGHHHVGAFGTYKGIPCITTEGMIETENTNAYGVLDIYEDKFVLRGKGRTVTHEVRIR